MKSELHIDHTHSAVLFAFFSQYDKVAKLTADAKFGKCLPVWFLCLNAMTTTAVKTICKKKKKKLLQFLFIHLYSNLIADNIFKFSWGLLYKSCQNLFYPYSIFNKGQ